MGKEEREEVMEEGVRERSEGFTWLASRMEGGARSQTAQATYRSWKRPGNEFSLEPLDGAQPADTLI